jgi:hypothetical protein
MMTEDRQRTGPTDEVGDEGGGSGELEVERTPVMTGSESTSTAAPEATEIEERDRQHSRKS